MMIKICGLTCLEDALFSCEQGATALGFNFYPASARYLDPERARSIILQLPRSVLKVGVVVRGSWDESADWSFLDMLQLHGYGAEQDLPSLAQPLLMAVGEKRLSAFPKHEIIVDSSWGKGKISDWSLLLHARRSFVLSGGLTPENVAGAIRLLRPSGVDVCSGVESSPGRKDPDKVRRFIQNSMAARETAPARSSSRPEETA